MRDATNRAVGSFWRSAPGAAGRVLPVALVLRLQRAIGNREVSRLLLARNVAPVEPSSAVVPAVQIVRSPLWIYLAAVLAGTVLGTIAAILAGLSNGMVIESGAAAATLAAGVTFLFQRVRSRNVRRRAMQIGRGFH